MLDLQTGFAVPLNCGDGGTARQMCPLCAGNISSNHQALLLSCSQCDVFCCHAVCLDQYLADRPRNSDVAIGKFECPQGRGALQTKTTCPGRIFRLLPRVSSNAAAGPKPSAFIEQQQHPRQHHPAKKPVQQVVQPLVRTHQVQRKVELPPPRQGVADMLAKVEAPAFVPGAEFVSAKAKARKAKKVAAAPPEPAAHDLQKRQQAVVASVVGVQHGSQHSPAQLQQQQQVAGEVWVTDAARYKVLLQTYGCANDGESEDSDVEDEAGAEWVDEAALSAYGGPASPIIQPDTSEEQEASKPDEHAFLASLSAALARPPAADGLYYFKVAGVQYLYDPNEGQPAASANAPVLPPAPIQNQPPAAAAPVVYHNSVAAALAAMAPTAAAQPLPPAAPAPQLPPAPVHLAAPPPLHLMAPAVMPAAEPPRTTSSAGSEESEDLSELLDLLCVHS